jgi:hypothetical protein
VKVIATSKGPVASAGGVPVKRRVAGLKLSQPGKADPSASDAAAVTPSPMRAAPNSTPRAKLSRIL